MTALLLTCPVCNAPVGQLCNAPTESGRRDVRWFHMLREDCNVAVDNADACGIVEVSTQHTHSAGDTA